MLCRIIATGTVNINVRLDTSTVIANYIESIANIISNTIAIEEALNNASEGVWESEEPEFIFQIAFDIC